MGRLIVAAAVLVLVGFAWRAFRRHRVSIVEALKNADKRVNTSAQETLVKDPATGVYRPVDRDT